MHCPNCSSESLAVIDSRPSGDAFGLGVEAVRRRRKCLDCGARITTYELPEKILNMMIETEASGAFQALSDIEEVLNRLGAKLEQEEIQPSSTEADQQRRYVVASSRNRFLRRRKRESEHQDGLDSGRRHYRSEG